jgi:hypothetical protein
MMWLWLIPLTLVGLVAYVLANTRVGSGGYNERD